ncbi:MAG: hypothetical protein IT318_00200 [Anaerolineales bacterium]|nr:hypothetical protein [Anaerolineales bacterium]
MQTNEPSPFQSVIGLGPFKSEFSSKGRGRWVNVVFGLLLVGTGPALVLLAAYLGYNAYNTRGLTRVDDAIAAPLCIAVAAFAAGVAVLFGAWRNAPMAAALYENGVALNTRKGLQQLAWTDIEAVWQAVTRHYTNGVYTGTTHVYTVRTKNGDKLVFDDRLGKQVEHLGQAIQRGATNHLYPQYVQSLENGQRLAFGPLALDRHKLYAGKKELPWQEIKAIKVEKGNISVKKDKGWFNWASAAVPQIPNFFIFYELIGHLAKVE